MISQRTKKGRVFVGLSGGVDSAVSAALLKKEGYDVTGVFIKAWNPPGFVCTWREDRRSAMRAAAVLDIPFITLDLEKEYKKEVVDYMIEEYKVGRTPNPDVMCNKEIKFGYFLKFALKSGADFVATGHYAQTSPRPRKLGLPLPLTRGGATRSEGGEVLLEAVDKNKDQSYFLWTLTHDQLKHTLFPIGHLEKKDVRKLAEKFKLPQATRKDSQGLCFLGKIDMKEFLKEYLETKKGEVLNKEGGVIGEHDGALLYTIGERHGFTVNHKSISDEPLYVIAKDIEKNTIIVSPKITTHQKSQREPLTLTNMNIIGELPKDGNIECRFRYRQEKVKCKVEIKNGKTFVQFNKPQDSVTPGQSLVFYTCPQRYRLRGGRDGEACLGGGIIA